MSTPDAHDVPKMVAIYKKLFLILVIITALGIGITYLHMPIWLAIVIAFVIMAIKAKVVIDSFKHLLIGRSSLVIIFTLTALIFVPLVVLPFMTSRNHIVGTQDLSKEVQSEQKSTEGEHHGH